MPIESRHRKRRNAVIYRNNDVIQIRPGVEITEIRTEVIDDPDSEDYERLRFGEEGEPIMEEENEDELEEGDEEFH